VRRVVDQGRSSSDCFPWPSIHLIQAVSTDFLLVYLELAYEVDLLARWRSPDTIGCFAAAAAINLSHRTSRYEHKFIQLSSLRHCTRRLLNAFKSNGKGSAVFCYSFPLSCLHRPLLHSSQPMLARYLPSSPLTPCA